MTLTVLSKPFQAPLAPETLADLITPVSALSPLGSVGYHCQVVVTPKFSSSGKSSKDRVHVAIYDNGAVQPSQQVASPVSHTKGAEGVLPVGALLVEFTFYGPADLGGARDSIRLGAASPACMRKNGRAVPLPFKDSVLFANRMYNWVYAQAQGLPGVSLPWTPFAQTMDEDMIAKRMGEEVERLEKAKKKDLFLSFLGLRS